MYCFAFYRQKPVKWYRLWLILKIHEALIMILDSAEVNVLIIS